jgi:non-homologous end joining protein Ku
VATTVKPEEMKLAQQVIATFEGPLDLANYKDEYREGLQRIIEARSPGKKSSRRRSRHHPGWST